MKSAKTTQLKCTLSWLLDSLALFCFQQIIGVCRVLECLMYHPVLSLIRTEKNFTAGGRDFENKLSLQLFFPGIEFTNKL